MTTTNEFTARRTEMFLLIGRLEEALSNADPVGEVRLAPRVREAVEALNTYVGTDGTQKPKKTPSKPARKSSRR